MLTQSKNPSNGRFWIKKKCPVTCGLPENAVLVAEGKTARIYKTPLHIYKVTKTTVKPEEIYVDRCIKDNKIEMSSGNDGFINQTIVSAQIASILDHADMCSLFVRQNSAFIYMNRGYTVLEPIEHGNFTDWMMRPGLNHETMDTNIIDCVYDVLSALSVLKGPNHRFVHADLKTNNIGVGVDADQNTVYKILDFDKSSLTYHGVRWYNKSLLTMIIPPKDFEKDSDWYTLSDAYIRALNNADIKSTVMYSREAFYMSYDVYILLYSIMRIRPVAMALMNDKLPGFYKILRSVFTLGDLVTLGRDVLVLDPSRAHSLTAMNYDLGVRRIRLMKDIGKLYTLMDLDNPDTRRQSSIPER